MSEHDQRDDAELVTPEENPHAPAVADEVLPDTLHLMPIPNRPFFPGRCSRWLSTRRSGVPR